MISREEAELLLQKHFKLPKFYDRQWETIEKLLSGKRVLLIEKTGFGKSLCFQFPAILFDGMTLIFSPLIALMRDQIKKLNELGINAKCINSEQTLDENRLILSEAKEGKIKILYIAPERQENNEWIDAVSSIKISMVVVDEAHCISVWGHDFRPAFKRIIHLMKLLPKGLPVLATTATATKKVEKDIAEQIGGDIEVIRGNLMRENFQLYVINVANEDEKMIWLKKILEKIPGSGIIYTGTRASTDIYSKWFEFSGITAVGYNAGLDAELRVKIEQGLMDNKWKCVISTNALGMGIDKPDIRFLIHTQIPQSPIHYYQEIGRAGRDGEKTFIILFYAPKDKELPEAFIETAKPSLKKYEKVIEELKKEMLGERDLMKKTNLRQTQIRTIKADLMDQKIIREAGNSKSKKYEYIYNAPSLDTSFFESIKEFKKQDLEKMIEYVTTNESRMKFLCKYLGDNTNNNFINCDNTGLKKMRIAITNDMKEEINQFHRECFPELSVRINQVITLTGIAASYYGTTDIGSIIHKCKYENGGDFPQTLIDLFVQAFGKYFGDEKFDNILYVPPTVSGDLVKNFALKVSARLNLPLSHELIKSRITKEQKIFENGVLKSENVKEAFRLKDPNMIQGKKVLLIDDIYDSGATIKEIGKYLLSLGVEKVSPMVIAKTVGGDLSD
jgi:ATP-dependent DNA helicase RecQ